MSEFCTHTFRDAALGGNNLISDVRAQGRPLADVAIEVMAMLQRQCGPKQCPLGGSSVHCDREVLKVRMPEVYTHMSHQVIDVSTVLNLGFRWLPGFYSAMTKDEAAQVQLLEERAKEEEGGAAGEAMRTKGPAGGGGGEGKGIAPDVGRRAGGGGSMQDHRAMFDVERSIRGLRFVRQTLYTPPSPAAAAPPLAPDV